MPRTATSLSSWAKAIRKALDASGCDSRKLFAQAGLGFEVLEDPNARYPLAAGTRLWQLAVQETGDPCFGLTVARHTGLTTFHALGYSIVASHSLKEAFERVLRYFRIITDVADLELSLDGEQYRFVMHVPESGLQPADESVDAFVAVFVRMCRTLAGRELNPHKVMLRRPQPPRVDCFEREFRAPIEFGAARNALYFDREAFERPLEGANPELARHNDQIAVRYLAHLDRTNITARVHAVLIEQLPLGEPSEEKVAQALHMSSRSLQRKLAEQNTSYKALLADTRRDLALSYIGAPHYSINEITYLLGFADTSSFTRAFRRWTGVPPGEYRDRGAA